MGVIKSSDLRDAEDVDVIGEVEKRRKPSGKMHLKKSIIKKTRVNRPINGQRKRFLPM